MTNPRDSRIMLVAALLSFPCIAGADTTCPSAVTDAAKKAYPQATITKCIAENTFFEVKMQKSDKSIVELDISAKGDIEQIEEVVPVSSVPAAVTKAFAARYPKATLLKIEKQTRSDKTITFEVAFKSGKTLKEATFKDDGTFVEEE
ncbi:MAG: hypothetical protein JWP01_803 [Myxococcales bacterium]|nr:hypothetical protein [Myxococcales bacterium]